MHPHASSCQPSQLPIETRGSVTFVIHHPSVWRESVTIFASSRRGLRLGTRCGRRGTPDRAHRGAPRPTSGHQAREYYPVYPATRGTAVIKLFLTGTTRGAVPLVSLDSPRVGQPACRMCLGTHAMLAQSLTALPRPGRVPEKFSLSSGCAAPGIAHSVLSFVLVTCVAYGDCTSPVRSRAMSAPETDRPRYTPQR